MRPTGRSAPRSSSPQCAARSAYVVFPWFLPAIGLASGVGPGIGLAIGLVAIGFNIASIRRFWAANHQWKVPITVLNCAVIAMLLVLVGLDVTDLLS